MEEAHSGRAASGANDVAPGLSGISGAHGLGSLPLS